MFLSLSVIALSFFVSVCTFNKWWFERSAIFLISFESSNKIERPASRTDFKILDSILDISVNAFSFDSIPLVFLFLFLFLFNTTSNISLLIIKASSSVSASTRFILSLASIRSSVLAF